MENSTTQDQYENQEQDGRKMPGEMHYRCSEYEGGGHELGIENNGGTFEGGNGPTRCCDIMDGWVYY